MTIFLDLLINLLPLYVLIAVGFCAGRFAKIDKHTLVNFLLYICLPVVIFGFVADLDLKPAYALLPLVIFAIHMVIGLGMLGLGRVIYGDARANLLSMCSAMGNAGYFGLPLILLLFDREWIGVYMFMLLGGIVYEGTFGYYIAARGKFTMRDSIIKVLKFPSVYAIAAGLLANLMHVELPDMFTTYWTYFKGCYVVFGMMIIGVALADSPKLAFVPRFVSLAFLGKFILWPALAFGFVIVDKIFLHSFDEPVRSLILVFSLVPPAANIAAFSAQFDIFPDRAATTVLAGTLFALFYIPAILALLGMQ